VNPVLARRELGGFYLFEQAELGFSGRRALSLNLNVHLSSEGIVAADSEEELASESQKRSRHCRQVPPELGAYCLHLRTPPTRTPRLPKSVSLITERTLRSQVTLVHARQRDHVRSDPPAARIMASSGFNAAAAKVASLPAPDKPKGYQELLQQTVTADDAAEQKAENLVAYASALLTPPPAIGIIATRPLLSQLITSLSEAPSEVQIQVGTALTELLQSQIASFEEQDAAVRNILADAHEKEEDWTAAAKALQGIHLDTTQRQIPDVDKVQIWIRIVRCFLEDDDTVSAETALNRIKNSNAAIPVLQSRPDLQLYYELSQARILDARRDFLNASTAYYTVSNRSSVDEADRLQALSAAIRTAILAPAGPPRSRTLGRLYKDERSAEVLEHGMLESMFLDRLLAPADVETFASHLAAHQVAKTADGSTVLDKAVLEHNLIAASRLYENISTESLARLLGLKDGKDDTAAEKAEDYAARMVEQGRLKAQIDQIAGVITFEGVPGMLLQGPDRELRRWDAGVQSVVEAVERCATAISETYPVSNLIATSSVPTDNRQELAQQAVH
jgi:COP9 signalosome complex subunit 4